MEPEVTARDVDAVALFAGLEAATIARAVSVARWERREAGRALVLQGEPVDDVYVLVDGAADVTIDGQTIEPGVLPGDCVGELAVLDGAPRAATVTTTAQSRLIAFDARDFRRLVEQSPMLRDRLTRALTQRLRQVSNGWIRLAAREVEQAADELDALTPAERRVAVLVAEGLSNIAIAERLYISRHTVESHLKNIYIKLDIRSRVSLATLVLRAA